MSMVNVFIGFDARQPVAAQVAIYSIYKNASVPMSITPLVINQLPLKRTGMTAFTYTRFLAPYLCDWKGVSIFLDSDVLVRGDLAELLAYPLMEPKTPVFVVKSPKKFEWASVMVFNNPLCQMLKPAYIENKHLQPLAFPWANTIGELPKEWNHLVGYDAPNKNAKLVHFTAGVPIWEETKQCEFADEWHVAAKHSMGSVPFEALMGQSVHKVAMRQGAIDLTVGA